MAVASRDQNNITTLIGALDTDGATIVSVQGNPTNHALSVDNNTTGSDHGPSIALRDQNNTPILMAVSSVDGVTPVAVYVDSTGHLLIDSN